MKTNFPPAGKYICLLLLFFFSTSTYALTVTNVIVHTKHEQATGSITVTPTGTSPYSFQWSTDEDDTTNTITGLNDGNYTVTVIDAADDTVIQTYRVDFYVSWFMFHNTYESEVHELICTRSYEEENLSQNITLGINRLKADSAGYIEFNFERADDFSGGFGMFAFDDQPGLMIMMLQDSLEDFPRGLYLLADNEAPQYFGDFVDSLRLQIRIVQEGDSVTIFKNGIESITREFIHDYFLLPVAMPFYEDDRIESVVCNFVTMLRPEPSADFPGCGSTGSLTATGAGGYPPYDYLWSTSETTSTITGLEVGLYTLTVYDATGDSIVEEYDLPFRVTWDTLVEFTEDSGGGITAVSTQGYYGCYAFALNTLVPSEDAGFEFVIAEGDTFQGVLGLINNPFADETAQGCAVIIEDTSIYVWVQEIGMTSFGNYTAGADYRFMFEIFGDSIRCTKTDRDYNEFYAEQTFEFTRTEDLIPMVTAYTNGSRVAEVNATFGCGKMRTTIEVIPAENVGAAGSVYVTVKGGAPGYTYDWSNGSATANLQNVAVGEYTLTVTDQDDENIVRNVFLGGYVEWDTLMGMEETEAHEIVTIGPDSNFVGLWIPMALGGNELPPDSNGILSFDFSTDSSFVGVIGLCPNPLFPLLFVIDTSSVSLDGIVLLAILPDTATGLNAGSNIYLLSDPNSEQFEYIGKWRNGVPLNLKIYVKEDSVTVVKNDMGGVGYEFNHKHALLPLIISEENSRIKSVTANFGDRLKVSSEITSITCGNDSGTGNIALIIEGGVPPFEYLWSNTSTDSMITGLDIGGYTVTITDDIGNIETKSFYVGYSVEWDYINRITVNEDGSLEPDYPIYEDSASVAVGANTLYTGMGETGWLEFKIKKGETFKGNFGFIEAQQDSTPFAIYFGTTGNIIGVYPFSVFDSSLSSIWWFNSERENIIRFEIPVSDSIRVLLNGNVLVQSHIQIPVSIKPVAGFIAEDSLETNSGSIESVSASFCDNSALYCQDSLDPVVIVSSLDTICTEGQVILSANAYPGAVMEWFANGCGETGVLVGTGDSLVIFPDSSATYFVRNKSFCPTTDTLFYSRCLQKRVNAISKPIAPPQQTVWFDSTYIFLFDDLVSGEGGDQIEWSINENFTGSNVIDNGDSIQITLYSGDSITIWLRSKNSETACVSNSVSTSARIISIPEGTPPIGICAFDLVMLQHRMANDSLFQIENEMNQTLEICIQNENAMAEERNGCIPHYVIPTVFYIIGSTTSSNVTYDMVLSQMDALNQAYEPHNISFCFPTVSSVASFFASGEPGVFRLTNTSQHDPIQNFPNPQTNNFFFLNSVRGVNTNPSFQPILSDQNYLKIYVVNDIIGGVAGVGFFPNEPNSCVLIERAEFGNSHNSNVLPCSCTPTLHFDEGEILVHEVGHFLGMYHVFGGPCGVYTDLVNDTPEQDEADEPASNGFCPTATHLCQTGDDNLENYMNYTGDWCASTFSTGQGTRLIGTLNSSRRFLCSPENMIVTGIECGSYAAFTIDNSNVCTGESITFQSLNPQSGDVVSWDFGDNSSSTSDPETHTYASNQTYTVTYTLERGGNIYCSQGIVAMSDCPDVRCDQSNWYFGNHGELHFQSGQSPAAGISDLVAHVPVTNPTMQALEGTAVQNDENCDLLFYTDGRFVWDDAHEVRNPTSGGSFMLLHGGGTDAENSTGQVAIGNNPSQTDQYYIFTLYDWVSGNLGFKYSIVDASSGITIPTMNVDMPSPNLNLTSPSFNEGIVTIPKKCDPNSYFVVTAVSSLPNTGQYGYETYAVVYLVNSSGISLASTFYLGNLQNSLVTNIKISPDSKRILFVSSRQVYVRDFDNVNGIISTPSNAFTLSGTSFYSAYGGSFSPNSQFLYLQSVLSGYHLHQYDLNDLNPLATAFEVTTNSVSNNTQLQIGPDNKIYVSVSLRSNFGVINNPDEQGINCNYNPNGPRIGFTVNQFSNGGLTNFSDALPNDIAITGAQFTYDVIDCDEVHFKAYTEDCNNEDYEWDFDDGSTSTDKDPVHTYAPGTYEVTLTINNQISYTAPPFTIGDISVTVGGPKNVPCSAVATYNYQVETSSGGFYKTISVIPASAASITTPIPGEIVLAFTSGAVVCTLQVTIVDYNGCTQTVNYPISVNCCTSSGYIKVSGLNYTTSQLLSNPDLTSFITGSTIEGASIAFTGNLIVDAPLVLVDCDWLMDAGSEIICSSNGLWCIGTKFHACDEMWKGITVYPSYSLAAFPSSNNRCEIEDALYAVEIKDNGMAWIQSTDFNDNFVGIFAGNENTSISFAHSLHNNRFTTLNGLRVYYVGESAASFQPQLPSGSFKRGWAGIHVNSATSLLVTENEFEDLAVGIYASTTKLTASRCRFKDILNGINDYSAGVSGLGIYHTGRDLTQTGNGNTTDPADFSFDHVSTCILAERSSSIDVRNNYMFNNCQRGVVYNNKREQTSAVIRDNRIVSVNKGIYLNNHPNLNRLQIRDNHLEIGTGFVYWWPFDNAGIELLNCIYPITSSIDNVIRDNNITVHYGTYGIKLQNCDRLIARANTINLTYPLLNRFGINLENTKRSMIWSNIVQGTSSSTQSIFTSSPRYPDEESPSGIRAMSSSENLYICNDVSTLRTGIEIDEPNSPSSLIANSMDNHTIGLYYNPRATTFDQTHALNKFVGTYSSPVLEAENRGVPALSLFTVNTTFNSGIYDPIPVAPTSTWFIPGSAGATADGCEFLDLFSAQAYFATEVTNANYMVANGDTLSSDYIEETIYEAQRQLYSLLQNDTSLLSDSVMLDFYNSTRQGNVGKFDSLSREIAAMYIIADSVQSLLDSLNTRIENLDSQIAVIDSIIANDPTITDYISYMQLIDSKLDSMRQNYVLIDSIIDTLDRIREIKIGDLETFNDNIEADLTWEENEKEYNNIYLQVSTRHSLSFTSEEAEGLLNIATQCPITGGEAVLKARALYSLIDDTLDYAEECSEGGSSKWEGNEESKPADKREKLSPQFLLYPNPTTDNFTLEFKNVNVSSMMVKVFDLQGSLIDKIVLSGNNGKHTFDVSGYSSSAISIRAEADGECLYTNRILITK